MIYIKFVDSPMGKIMMSSEDGALTGLWFDNGRYFAEDLKKKTVTDISEPDSQAETAKPETSSKNAGEVIFENASTCPDADGKVFELTEKWLKLYFEGKDPGFLPPYRLTGSDFRKRVGEIMLEIPYGKTITYGDIAQKIAAERGLERMSAQAVGGAVGHNPISIIVPCHRVVGTNGSLTGYGGGMPKKVALLTLEGHDVEKEFSIPTKGTAL